MLESTTWRRAVLDHTNSLSGQHNLRSHRLVGQPCLVTLTSSSLLLASSAWLLAKYGAVKGKGVKTKDPISVSSTVDHSRKYNLQILSYQSEQAESSCSNKPLQNLSGFFLTHTLNSVGVGGSGGSGAHCSQWGCGLTETPSQHMLPWSPRQEEAAWGGVILSSSVFQLRHQAGHCSSQLAWPHPAAEE